MFVHSTREQKKWTPLILAADNGLTAFVDNVLMVSFGSLGTVSYRLEFEAT